MKTKTFNIITKSNQVIFFVGSLLFVLFLATMLIREMVRPDYSNRGVVVAREIDNENTPSTLNMKRVTFNPLRIFILSRLLLKKS